LKALERLAQPRETVRLVASDCDFRNDEVRVQVVDERLSFFEGGRFRRNPDRVPDSLLDSFEPEGMGVDQDGGTEFVGLGQNDPFVVERFYSGSVSNGRMLFL
jgi:hypothetical protein